MTSERPQRVREQLWVPGAVLLAFGAVLIFVSLLSISSVYTRLGTGAFSNPNAPVPNGYPDTLLGSAYATQAVGFLMALIGIVFLLVPRR